MIKLNIETGLKQIEVETNTDHQLVRIGVELDDDEALVMANNLIRKVQASRFPTTIEDTNDPQTYSH